MNKTPVPVPEEENISDKNKKRKIYIGGFLACVFLAFLAINLFVIVPVSGGNEGDACVRCHSMVPQYVTWQASNHAQFQCKECHKEPGLVNLIKYQGRMVKEFLFYRASDNPKIIVAEVPDSSCKQCHSSNRKVTASSDTIIPHDKHENKGISCVTCHSGVAHGGVVKRGMNQKLSASEWTADVGMEQMDFKYTTPRMDLCLDCHGERKVDTTCSVCHSNLPVPDSHKPDSWMSEGGHGLEAQQDFKPCNLCHVYTMRKEVDLLNTSLYGYIRVNNFCTNCHAGEKPPGHKKDSFLANHGQEARSKGNSNCFVCHNLDKDETKSGGWPNKVNCNDCHWFKDKLF